MTKFAAAIAFLALNFYTYNYLGSGAVIPERETFDTFPLEIDGWVCARRTRMEDQIEKNLGVSDYMLCDYRNEEEVGLVNFYVGYHATQVREEGGGWAENAIHPPAHCLPGSGWDIVSNESTPLGLEGVPHGDASVRRLLIAKGDARQLVYYWYHSRGRVISEDWLKVIYVGWDRATRKRTDGSLVRFTMPVIQRDVERSEAMFRSLAPEILKQLPRFVPE